MEAQELGGGFTNPPVQAAEAFRNVMEAMARPGTIQEVAGALPPEPLSPAAGAVLLTLCGPDTPIYLAGAADCMPVRRWIAFHTGAPYATPETAMFALGNWDALLPLEAYPNGTAAYPDRSATLIVEQPTLSQEGTTLRGPGIRETATLALPNPALLQANHALFPLGLDFLFTSGSQIAALPRSTEVL